MPSGRLELRDGQPVGSPVRHQTTSRVISGSVAVTFSKSSVFNGNVMLLEGLSEPTEDVIGGAAVKLNVIHLERPYEWIAPAYDGGQVVATVAEVQTAGRRTYYRAAGFLNADEWTDVLNHETFEIVILYTNSDGTVTVQKLHNCRVLNPIRPTGDITRGTLRRSLRVPIGYTHRSTIETTAA